MPFFGPWFGTSAKKPVSARSAPASVFTQFLRSVQSPVSGHAPQSPSPSVPAADGTAPRPGERSARREMVYSSVRESMVRSGILSAGYKFKVLALDKRATQFIVMVDLAEQFAATPDKLAQIEALMVYSAKARFDILVTAVYWRLNGRLGGAKAHPGAQPAPPAMAPVAPVPALSLARSGDHHWLPP